MKAITVDDSRLPLLLVTYNRKATNAEFQAYLDEVYDVRERGPWVAVLDATNGAQPDAAQRKLQADWLKQHEKMLERNVLGTAFVINSTLMRGMLTAIFWLSPLPGPHVVVATSSEAEAWAAARLAETGRSIPVAGKRSA